MLRFLFLALETYYRARRSGKPCYAALTVHGVPKVCVFVAIGREAWRVSQYAVEHWQPDKGENREME